MGISSVRPNPGDLGHGLPLPRNAQSRRHYCANCWHLARNGVPRSWIEAWRLFWQAERHQEAWRSGGLPGAAGGFSSSATLTPAAPTVASACWPCALWRAWMITWCRTFRAQLRPLTRDRWRPGSIDRKVTLDISAWTWRPGGESGGSDAVAIHCWPGTAGWQTSSLRHAGCGNSPARPRWPGSRGDLCSGYWHLHGRACAPGSPGADWKDRTGLLFGGAGRRRS